MFVFTCDLHFWEMADCSESRYNSRFFSLPWDDSKQTTEQLLSASINTEKEFKATLFVSFEVCPAGLPNVLCVCVCVQLQNANSSRNSEVI